MKKERIKRGRIDFSLCCVNENLWWKYEEESQRPQKENKKMFSRRLGARASVRATSTQLMRRCCVGTQQQAFPIASVTTTTAILQVQQVQQVRFAGTERPGDWSCPSCNESNFSRRNRCFRCNAMKPGGGDSNAGTGFDSPRPPRGDGGSSGGGDAANRPGDWNCASCNTSNFARRTSCFSCNAPKP